MATMGAFAGRNSLGYYAREFLNDEGRIMGYAVFTREGYFVESWESLAQAEGRLTELEGKGPPPPAKP